MALALPEAVQADHHGNPSFRVIGRIFATLPDPGHMNVMLDEPGVRTAATDLTAPPAQRIAAGFCGDAKVALRQPREAT
jgi:hypothetical protein